MGRCFPPSGLLAILSGSIMKGMNLGFPEMIFLFLLALIIFGPKKMPEIGRQIGRALNEFKRASNEFKSQIESEISQLDVEPARQILPPPEAPKGAVAVGTLPVASTAGPAPDGAEPGPASTDPLIPDSYVPPSVSPDSVAKAQDA